MAQVENPVVQQLEEQLAQIRERLARPQRRDGGWWVMLGGLGLGALAGCALVYLVRSRDEEPPYIPPAPPRRDDAILLRPAAPPAPTPAQAEQEDEPIELKSPGLAAAAPVLEATPEPVAAATPEPVAPAMPDDTSSQGSEASAGDTPARPEQGPQAPAYAGSVSPQDAQCPPSHPVKGNLSRSGELIFHVPGSHNYDRTKPEACFASEADAEAAGFRKARS